MHNRLKTSDEGQFKGGSGLVGEGGILPAQYSSWDTITITTPISKLAHQGLTVFTFLTSMVGAHFLGLQTPINFFVLQAVLFLRPDMDS